MRCAAAIGCTTVPGPRRPATDAAAAAAGSALRAELYGEFAGVEGWSGVGWVTVRDQVVMPLVQGTLWTLALSGWRYWNREAQVGGATVGGRIRRWWGG
ncbi:MAG: hypothetical protein FRX48_03977 [Lasallia pustulata]|uniref:Uncharacterized protein n=1 Tax=Lasallia pustulata TaxID=136370 RepID=A0A5M8PQT9_9LECA|nr:MAG: hypothetical protein FRX48_03977 [Lasallia pustulata]